MFWSVYRKANILINRAQTRCDNKKHNTVKLLIGVTPQENIGFISKGWNGSVSDIYIRENSGLLHHLLPGDVVLADRGFNIQEDASMYCAEVKLPPFTKGKKQLSQMEVDVARKLSRIKLIKGSTESQWLHNAQAIVIILSTVEITESSSLIIMLIGRVNCRIIYFCLTIPITLSM